LIRPAGGLVSTPLNKLAVPHRPFFISFFALLRYWLLLPFGIPSFPMSATCLIHLPFVWYFWPISQFLKLFLYLFSNAYWFDVRMTSVSLLIPSFNTSFVPFSLLRLEIVFCKVAPGGAPLPPPPPLPLFPDPCRFFPSPFCPLLPDRRGVTASFFFR